MNKLKNILAESLYEIADNIEKGSTSEKVRIGLTLFDGEHDISEFIKAALIAEKKYSDIEVVLIGSMKDLKKAENRFKTYNAETPGEAHTLMEKLLDKSEISGCVTLHYSFPIGVSTVGKVITPSAGKEMFIASTTGSSDFNKNISMVKNVISGIAAAKADKIINPEVGVLNIDGASAVIKALLKLKINGYEINFSESARSDRGIYMRGNDLIQGTPDVMIADSLTGNLLVKIFSSFVTGGSYEASGFGYGPGIGEGQTRLINIISRASGAPVIAESIRHCADCFSSKLINIFDTELKAARKAGLDKIIAEMKDESGNKMSESEIESPEEKITDQEIHGIDILEIENAGKILWKEGIFARTGMGCTGPVVMTAKEDLESARSILIKEKYL